MTLCKKGPDQIVILIREGEVRSANLWRAESSNQLLCWATDWAVRPVDRDRRRRILCERVAQLQQVSRIVPVHPHAESNRLLRLPCCVGEDALLAEADECGESLLLNLAFGGVAELALNIHLNPESLTIEPLLPTQLVAE